MKNKGIVVGGVVGLMLTAPLVAVLYLGAQAGGLPFVPFDVFNGLARVLPGEVITLGIDSIVSLISGLDLGETSSTAKTIEQLMALLLFLLTGAGGTALFFVVQQSRQAKSGLLAGLIFGVLSAVPMLIIVFALNTTATADPLLSGFWLLLAFAGWGVVVAWVYDNLRGTANSEEFTRAADLEAAPHQERELVSGPAVTTQALNRRQFLVRIGNAAALITVAGAGIGSLLESEQTPVSLVARTGNGGQTLPPGLPNAGASLFPAPGTRLEYTPLEDHYRIDISLLPPNISADEWVLPIEGLVNNPLTLTLDDLRAYPKMEQYITMACISNPVGGDLIGTTLWKGVSLQQILADAELQEDAAYLKITGADGFHETVAVDLINEDERVMLCYEWDNQPLTVGHGFPLRIYIPDRYGMKQPKWITDIEVISAYEEGYWVRRGWDEVARMRTTSVVDTVASNALVEDGGQLWVPVGGIAHAGARGISKVEVKVDGGAWQPAQLRDPLSDTSWVVWRYDWPFEEGRHKFSVRAYDGNGVVQDETARGPRPSGATGIHDQSVTLQRPEDSDPAGAA
jgi:DMSO/TMAO reductase YedYZ molybdopterin-dependent catalytic subunit